MTWSFIIFRDRQRRKSRSSFYDRIDRKVFLLKLTPGMSPELIPYILKMYDCIIVEGFGVGGLPDGLTELLLSEMKKYRDHEKVLIMATQVTYEGSSMGTYVVGRQAKDRSAVSGNLRYDAGGGFCKDNVDTGASYRGQKRDGKAVLHEGEL